MLLNRTIISPHIHHFNVSHFSVGIYTNQEMKWNELPITCSFLVYARNDSVNVYDIILPVQTDLNVEYDKLVKLAKVKQ